MAGTSMGDVFGFDVQLDATSHWITVQAARSDQGDLRGLSVPVPVYQRIAAEAAGMRAGGAGFRVIAAYFGVDDHAAAKAVRWFQGEL